MPGRRQRRGAIEKKENSAGLIDRILRTDRRQEVASIRRRKSSFILLDVYQPKTRYPRAGKSRREDLGRRGRREFLGAPVRRRRHRRETTSLIDRWTDGYNLSKIRAEIGEMTIDRAYCARGIFSDGKEKRRETRRKIDHDGKTAFGGKPAT